MSTVISLQEFKMFLDTYRKRIKLPIGNYGGGYIEGEEVRDILTDLEIINASLNKQTYHVSGNLSDNDGKVRKLFNAMGVLNGYEILDYSTGIDLMRPLNGTYNTGICMDTLEHTENPFVVADNITNSLSKGALLFVTVPWIWGVHMFPIDNWRFTDNGLITLFPKMKVLESRYVKDAYDSVKKLQNERVIAIFEK